MFYQQFDYYDSKRMLCCLNPFCINPTIKTIINPETKSAYFCFHILTMLIFIGIFLYSLYVQWQRHSKIIHFDSGKAKNLLSCRQYFERLNFPETNTAVIIFSGISAFYIFCDIIFATLIENPDHSSISDFIVLSVSATAVLFPLVLLVMQGESKNFLGIFSNPEVLLRHAFALPISIILLDILMLSPFAMSYYWVRVNSVLSLFLAGAVLVRLLHVIFDPQVWKDTEEKILKSSTIDSINDTAFERFGINKTGKKMKDFEPGITSFYSFSKEEEFEFINVTTPKIGSVESIDFVALQKISETLNPEASKKGTDIKSDKIVEKESKKSELIFQIVLRAQEGETIAKEDELLATLLKKRDKTFSIADEDLVQQVRQAFKIGSKGTSKKSGNQIDYFLRKLNQLGREAIKNEDILQAEKIRDIYSIILDSVLEAFEKLNFAYTSKAAKQEVGVFGQDWKPVTRIFKNVRDLTIKTLEKIQVDYEIKNTIIYIPYYLASKAYKSKEILTYMGSLQLANLQQNYASAKDVLPPASWLGSLADYHIRIEIERYVFDEEKIKEIMPFAKFLFETYLLLGRSIIDSGLEISLDAWLKLITKHPKVFEYEHFSSQLETQRIYLNHIQDAAEKKKAIYEIEKIEKKQKIKIKFSQWRQEIVLGVLAYCFLQIDKKGNPEAVAKVENLTQFVKKLLMHLPTDSGEVISLIQRLRRTEFDEKWNWDFWEHMPNDEVKWLEFPSYVDKVLAILLLRSASLGGLKQDLSHLNLEEKDTFDFRSESQNIGGKLSIFSEQVKKLQLFEIDEKHTEDLKAYLGGVVKNARINSELLLTQKPISESRIAQIKESFDISFTEKNRFRKIFELKGPGGSSKKSESQWGINILTRREYFIEQTDLHFSDIGKDYAQGLSSSEEELVFNQISELADVSEAKTVFDLVKALQNCGVELKNIVILTKSNPWLSRTLRLDPSFKYGHQVEVKKYRDAHPEGYIVVDGCEIPIFSVFFRGEKIAKLDFIALDTSKNILQMNPIDKASQVPRTHFSVRVTDPLSDPALKKQILDQKPDWLSDAPEELKEKLVGRLVWLRILEDLEVVSALKPLGFARPQDDAASEVT